MHKLLPILLLQFALCAYADLIVRVVVGGVGGCGVVWVPCVISQWVKVTYSVKVSLLSKSTTLSNEPFFTTPTSLFFEQKTHSYKICKKSKLSIHHYYQYFIIHYYCLPSVPCLSGRRVQDIVLVDLGHKLLWR